MKPLFSLCLILIATCFPQSLAQQIRIPLIPRPGINSHSYHNPRFTNSTHNNHFHPESLYKPVNLAANPNNAPLTNYDNTIFTGEIKLGTPALPFRVVFDTGSADLWVFSASTNNQNTRSPLNQYYNRQASTTFQSQGDKPWNIQYGAGTAAGVLVSDSGELAGAPFKNQIFAEAYEYSSHFTGQDAPFSGVFGLGYQSLAKSGAPTVIDTLKAQGMIPRRRFSFYLTKNKEPAGSVFLLGDPDLSYAPKGLTEYPVLPSAGAQQWVIQFDSMKIGTDSDSGLCGSGRICAALMDTGTSFIGLPSNVFNNVMKSVTANRPDCSTIDSSGIVGCTQMNNYDNLPTVHFKISGSDYPLAPWDYMTNGIIGIMNLGSSAGGSSVDFIILGDTFLKTYYSVFDMDSNTISLANPDPENSRPPTLPDNSADPSLFAGSTIALIIILCGGFLLMVALYFLCRNRHSNNPSDAEINSHYIQQRSRENSIIANNNAAGVPVAVPVSSAAYFANRSGGYRLGSNSAAPNNNNNSVAMNSTTRYAYI